MVEEKLKPLLNTKTILIVENKEHWYLLKEFIYKPNFFTEDIYLKKEKYCFNLMTKRCESLSTYKEHYTYKNYTYISSNAICMNNTTYELW